MEVGKRRRVGPFGTAAAHLDEVEIDRRQVEHALDIVQGNAWVRAVFQVVSDTVLHRGLSFVSGAKPLAPRPFLRTLVMRLPEALQPAPIRHGLVVELDRDGRPLRSLHDTTGDVALVTSVMERDGRLYLGSHKESSVVVVELGADEAGVTSPTGAAKPAANG